MDLKRLSHPKTILFLVLGGIILILWLATRAAREVGLLPPKIEPTFGELPQPPLEEGSFDLNPLRQEAKFTDETLSKTATVYRQLPFTLSQDRALEIAKSLGFSNPSVQGVAVFSQEDKRYIMVTTNSGIVTLKQALPEYLKPFTTQALEDYARLSVKQIVGENELWSDLVSQIEYSKGLGAHEVVPATPGTANLATINYFPRLNSLRIVGKGLYPLGRTGIATVRFNAQTDSVSVTISLIEIDLSQTGTYPLKTIDQVKEEIRNRKTEMTILIPEGESYQNLGYDPVLIPTSAEFTDIELVYYYTPNPDAFLQPVYLFSGRTKLTDGRPAIIESVMPAIDPQYLKSP